jgi:hypothetical protein
MTSDRAAKNAARARMAKTGEPYSVARRAGQPGDPRSQARDSSLVQDSSLDWHFVALGSHHALGPWQHHATIRDARTGEVTATVPTPPAVHMFDRVTSASTMSAAREQLHVLAAQQAGQDSRAGDPLQAGSAPVFYVLRSDAGGRVADLSPMPVDALLPLGLGSPSIAVTPDGTQVLGAQSRRRDGAWETVVYTVQLATGEVVILADAIPGQLSELSWAADGQNLAAEWNPSLGRWPGGQPGIYLAGIADLANGSVGDRLATLQQGNVIAPVISRDGSAVYVTAAQADLSGGAHWNRLLEVPVGGGNPRTLFELRYQVNPANLVYIWTRVRLDPSGRYLLLLGVGWAYLVEIAAATARRIPYPS